MRTGFQKEDDLRRYQFKIKWSGGVDPNCIDERNFRSDITKLQRISNFEIGHYLLNTTDFYTKQQSYARKGLDAYKFFVGRLIKSANSTDLTSYNTTVVIAKVRKGTTQLNIHTVYIEMHFCMIKRKMFWFDFVNQKHFFLFAQVRAETKSSCYFPGQPLCSKLVNYTTAPMGVILWTWRCEDGTWHLHGNKMKEYESAASKLCSWLLAYQSNAPMQQGRNCDFTSARTNRQDYMILLSWRVLMTQFSLVPTRRWRKSRLKNWKQLLLTSKISS